MNAARDKMTADGTIYQQPGDSGYDALTMQIRQAEAEQELLAARWRATSSQMSSAGVDAGSDIRGSLEGAVSACIDAYNRFCKVMVNGFRTIGSWASRAAGIIRNALAGALVTATTGFRNIFTGGKSASSAISDFGRRVASLVKAAVVFNVIRRALSEVTSGIGDAVRAFARYNGELNTNISALQTALSGLQGAIASAFAPIINAAVPAIVTLINYLTTAINTLGQFMAALTGRTSYTRLIANQKNYAESLDKTGAAAKSATSNLAKFDDLDVLNKDSGSGSGTGTDFSGTEEVPIDGAVADLADLFKNGDFFDFGYKLADMLADMLEQIPWEDIRTKAYEMGQHLAEILNGVFANLRLAVDLGITLAQAINTALDFAYGFITAFDWTQFGVWWGYFFNAFVQTMDWNLLGDTILAGLDGVIAAIKAFLTTIYSTMQTLGQNLGSNVQKVMTGINWTGIADTILMGLTDITALINGWNAGVNWTEIADSMMNGINELAQGMVMDPNGIIHQVWSENGTTVGVAIQNFLAGCHEFVSQFPFEQFTQSISQWFRSAMAAVNWSEAGDTINQLVTGLIDSISDFIGDSRNRQAIAKAVADLFEGLDLAEITQSIFDLLGSMFDLFTETINEMDWLTIGTLILEAIIVGLIAADPVILAVAAITLLIFELLQKLALDIAENVQESMQGIWQTISTVGATITALWDTLWTTIRQKLADIWTAMQTSVTTIFNAIKTTINTVLNAIKTIWTTLWTAINQKLVDIWTAMQTSITTIFNAIRSNINAVLNAIKTIWTTLWTAIQTILSTIWTTMQTLTNARLSDIRSIITTILNAIQTIWRTCWTAVSTVLSTIWTTMTSLVSTSFHAIATIIGTVLDSISTRWGDIWRGMKNTLKGIINSIIGFINGMLSGMTNGINAVIDALNELHWDIPDWVPKYGGKSFGFDISHIHSVQIPTLANGGITTGATLAQIGEAGTEAVLPLEQNTGWMDDLAMKIADVIDSRTGSGIHSVTMELNGQELARVALDDLVSEINRRGMTADIVFG